MNGCTANGSKLYWERDGDSLVDDDDVDDDTVVLEDEVITFMRTVVGAPREKGLHL